MCSPTNMGVLFILLCASVWFEGSSAQLCYEGEGAHTVCHEGEGAHTVCHEGEGAHTVCHEGGVGGTSSFGTMKRGYIFV